MADITVERAAPLNPRELRALEHLLSKLHGLRRDLVHAVIDENRWLRNRVLELESDLALLAGADERIRLASAKATSMSAHCDAILNALKRQPYPRVLYDRNGREHLVVNKAEETKARRRGVWFETPDGRKLV